VRRTDNLTTFMCRLSRNLGASDSWNPKGLSRPVMGLLYLYLYLTTKPKQDVLYTVLKKMTVDYERGHSCITGPLDACNGCDVVRSSTSATNLTVSEQQWKPRVDFLCEYTMEQNHLIFFYLFQELFALNEARVFIIPLIHLLLAVDLTHITGVTPQSLEVLYRYNNRHTTASFAWASGCRRTVGRACLRPGGGVG
jgi:hypothetical protein